MLRSLRQIATAWPAPMSGVFAAMPVASSFRAAIARAAPLAGSSVRHLTALRSSAAASVAHSSSSSSCPASSCSTSCRCCAAGAPRSARSVHPVAAHGPRRGFSTLEAVGDAFGVPATDDPHARFVVLYTCKVCETRAAKSVSRQAYTAGVVLLRCDGCQKLHLFADHLGWFDDERVDIESIMAEKGLKVGRTSLELGKEQLEQLELLQRNMQAQAEANKARAAAAKQAHQPHDNAHAKAPIDAEDAVIEPHKKTTHRKKSH
jgi:hypothetical protein